MSLSKQRRSVCLVLLLGAFVGAGAGCHGTRHSTHPNKNAPGSTKANELNPVECWNRYLPILAEGDKEAMRGWIYVHPGERDMARLEGSLSVLSSTARLRKACDQVYGKGRLVRAGFRCITPESRVSPQTKFRIEGEHATIFGPGLGKISLVRHENKWKEDFLPWEEILELRSKEKDSNKTLSLESLLLNLPAVTEILDRTTAEVLTTNYLSAAEVFGTLNGRLHGQAAETPPLGIAYTTDVTSDSAANPKTDSPIPVFEFRGDARALGQSQGTQMGESIRNLYHGYFDRAFQVEHFMGRMRYKGALKLASGFERFLRPEHREELFALAHSVGFKPAEALLGQCFADLNPDSACSTIALPAEAAPDGIARFGRNLDYQTFGILERHSVLLVYHPKDRYAFASIAAPGLMGVLSGMNEHGLTLAIMEVTRPFRKPEAMPFMLLYRTILENCRNVNEAIELLRKTPRQSANNLMLMDATGDRAVAEITPNDVIVRRAPATAALISTNHQRGGDLNKRDQCNRFDFLHDSAHRQFGRLSERSVEEMLAGAAQGDFTFQSMVFEPANRVLYLAVGGGAPNHGFKRIELKPYFLTPLSTR